jgi:hypothetical protein
MAYEQDIGGAPPAKAGMSPWLKLAIGCGAFLLLICVICVAGMVYLGVKAGQWGEKIQAQMQEIDGAEGTEVGKLLAQAETENTFTEPAPPSATAERIEVFFKVRERSLEKARAVEADLSAMEDMDKKQEPSFGDVAKIFETIFGFFESWAEVRMDFATALVEEGMSEAEYTYLFRLMCLSGLVEMDDPEYVEDIEIEIDGLQEVPPEVQALVQGYADRLKKEPVTSADALILGEGSEQIARSQGMQEF